MPEASASQNERRTSSTAPARPGQPQAAADNQKMKTRSVIDPAAPAKQTTKYKEARKYLRVHGLLAENAACTPQSMAGVLLLMTESYKLPDNIIKALEHTAETIQHMERHCQGCDRSKDTPELIKDLRTGLSAELDKKLEALEHKIALSTQDQLKSVTKEIEQAAVSIGTSADDIRNSIVKVSDTSTQLATTATTYRDTLLNAPAHSQERSTHSDPRIHRDVDRKARQILIDTMDEKILGASLTEIKNKVSAAFQAITDPPPPKDTTIVEISKLRRGGITILFKDIEVIKWLQDPATEVNFTAEIAPDAMITKRSYAILVPRIPLSFDPASSDHLREIEESNDIPPGAIVKARWIKPEYRRTPEQRAAHAIFSIRDPNIANICIRDGIYVCGLRIRPSRLKHEPMQCMKCRRWGHFAHSCTATSDACGTCSGDHRTNECQAKEKTHCVSCKSNTHASWDRNCPEFLRRCAQYDENYPENNLPYFPTSEDWTLTTRPSRLALPEKFPAQYAVGEIPQTKGPNTAPATKNNGKQRKRTTAKTPANQATIDKFLNPSQRPNREGAPTARRDRPTENEEDAYPNRATCGTSPQPGGWD
jgi:hypothetical protein